jgi:hypothetical protein
MGPGHSKLNDRRAASYETSYESAALTSNLTFLRPRVSESCYVARSKGGAARFFTIGFFKVLIPNLMSQIPKTNRDLMKKIGF